MDFTARCKVFPLEIPHIMSPVLEIEIKSSETQSNSEVTESEDDDW